MSDSSTTLVPERIFIAAAEREQMEKRITSWMIEKGWIEPEISDCVLSEGGGRRITRKGNTHISGCEPDRGLAVNGFCVEQFDGKNVFTNLEGGLESAVCSGCGEDIGEEFYDMTEAWFSGEDNPPVPCPCCGESFDIRDYVLEPPWGFSQIGFTFWNLWDMTDEFVEEFAAVLGEPVQVVWAHL